MNRERLLEIGLEEVVGGRRSPDVAARVLAAAGPRHLKKAVIAGVLVALVALIAWLAPSRGESIVMGAGTGPVRRVLAGGAVVEVDPPASVLLSDRSATLRLGSLGVRGPLEIRTALGVVRVAEGSEADLSLDGSDLSDPTRLGEDDELRDPALIVECLRGEVTCADRRLTSGQGLIVEAQGPRMLAPPSEDERAELDGALRILGEHHPPGSAASKRADLAARKLGLMLLLDPGGWMQARPVLRSRLRTARDADTLARTTVLLSQDPDRRSLRNVLEAHRRRPEAVPETALLVVAERGAARAERALEPLAESSVRVAAYFALRGDRRGRKTLEEAWSGAKKDEASRVLVAAALRRIGRQDPWTETLARVKDAARAALADTDLERARSLLIEAEYYAARTPHPGPASVVEFTSRASYAERRRGRLSAAPDIERALDGLR